MKATLVVLLGGPGAGKGTQAKRIVEKTGAAHVATGDLFRKNLADNTMLGILAKRYMADGQLVPDNVTIEMLRNQLRQVESDLIILDGFPRNVVQAEALWKLLDDMGISFGGVIYLYVSETVLVRRLLAREDGRTDDMPDAIFKRLQVYQDQTTQLIPYFEERELLHTIDGEGNVEKVWDDIAVLLEGILQVV